MERSDSPLRGHETVPAKVPKDAGTRHMPRRYVP